MSGDWVGRGEEDMLCSELKEVPEAPTMCRGHSRQREADEHPVDHKRPSQAATECSFFM